MNYYEALGTELKFQTTTTQPKYLKFLPFKVKTIKPKKFIDAVSPDTESVSGSSDESEQAVCK